MIRMETGWGWGRGVGSVGSGRVAHMMNSERAHTPVATPPMSIQGLKIVCPPITSLSASVAQSYSRAGREHSYTVTYFANILYKYKS